MYLLRVYKSLFILVFLFALNSNQVLAETKKLVFSKLKGSVAQQSGADLLTEIYKRLGIEISFMHLPARRALDLSNKGKTDGEVFRVWSVGDVYKNLIRVPTPIISLNNYAYALDKKYIVNSAEELKRVPRIGIIRGIIWAEKLVDGRRGAVYTDNWEDLVNKLVNGSVDVILANRPTIKRVFEKLALTDKPHESDPINVIYVYHYIRKSHEGLVVDVDAEIQKMIHANEIEKFTGLPYTKKESEK